MPLPKPQLGNIINYRFLWKEESESGQIEGLKARPSLIVSIQETVDKKVVRVIPISTKHPSMTRKFLEITPNWGIQALPTYPSYLILDEINEFVWPGYDIEPLLRSPSSLYGRVTLGQFTKILESINNLNEKIVIRD